MRILFATPSIGWPLSFGGDIRKWNSLQALLQAGEVDAVVLHRNANPLSVEAFRGCRRIFQISAEHLAMPTADAALYQSAWGRGILALFRKEPFEYLADLDSILEESSGCRFAEYDLIWVCGAQIGKRLRIPGNIPAILDGDDFAYVRNWHLLRNSPWYGAKLWNYLNVAKLWWHERRLAKEYAAVVRCSDEDKSRHPAPNVHVIPNGATMPAEIHRRPEKCVLFVGDLGYEPNAQGVEWFLESVWPRVRDSLPSARLELAGRLPSQSIRRADGRDGISVLGFVDDLGTTYARSACSIVPVLAGGGTRLKILESLAFGVPVVSTSLGAFGITAGMEHGLRTSDTAASFADACIECLNSPEEWNHRALAGRALVGQRYNWMAVRARMTALATLIATAGSSR